MEKIIEILVTFNKRDIKRFEMFLQSPIFNTRQQMVDFFQIITANFPRFEQNKETIFLKLNPGTSKYNELVMKGLFREFHKLTKKFIAFEEQQTDKKLQDRSLLEAMMSRGILAGFEKELKRIRKGQAKETVRESEFLFHQFNLEDIAFRYNTVYRNRKLTGVVEDPTKCLDYYYLLHKLRYNLTALVGQKVLRQSQAIWMTREVINYLKTTPLEEYPLIPLYYNLVLLFKDMEEEKPFFVLKKLLENHKEEFSTFELRQVGSFAVSYCRLKANQGHDNFKEEEFSLYKLLIEKEAICMNAGLKSQHLSPHRFHNIVHTGIDMAVRGKETFEWTANFIQNYKDLVLISQRVSVYNFCMASFLFAQKKYSETQDYLVKIQFEEVVIDFYYTIYYKTLEIQTAYELKEWNVLDSALETFRLYLSRHKKIAPSFQTTYNNFQKLTRKLFTRKTSNRTISPAAIEDLKIEIQTTNPLRERLWLLEKAAELRFK